MNFTLVTPFVTQWGLKKWGGLIDHILGLDNKNEIVFNDFGLFYQAAEKHDSVVPVLGRLLTKQKRGPRIKRLMGMVPDETIEHFRHFNADTPLLSDFYRKLGFGRFELDNTLQGLHRDSSVRASLYYPYAYVSTTRMCLVNRCDQRRADMRAIFPCARECREIRFCISHGEIPGKVILAGNTQFIINDMLPENLDEIGVDRIVYEPCIPI